MKIGLLPALNEDGYSKGARGRTQKTRRTQPAEDVGEKVNFENSQVKKSFAFRSKQLCTIQRKRLHRKSSPRLLKVGVDTV